MIRLMDLLPNFSNHELNIFVEGLDIDLGIDIHQADSTSKNIPFSIGDKKYEVRVDVKITSDKKSIGEFKFYLMNNLKSPKRKNFETDQQYLIAVQKSQIGVTNSGDSFTVFSRVLSIMFKYCEENKLDYITFTADEENRQKLYERIIKKMILKYNIPYKQIDKNPVAGNELTPEEMWMERI